MLLGVWQALNFLSIHVTFTAIVPGAYTGEAKMCKKCAKKANFQTSGLNYWETVEDRWVYTTRRFTSIESSFQPSDTYRDCSRGVHRGGRKCAKNVLKWQTFKFQAWITGKRFKIDEYVQHGVLQALNPLSNRVTLTAIVPGATPYGGVKCKGG